MTGAHIHLLLTHVPVMAALFGLLILAYAMVRKNPGVVRIGFGLFVIAGLAAVATYFTGEAAEEVVEHLPGISEAVIERHEEAALFGLIGAAFLGVVSLFSLLRFRQSIPGWLTSGALVLALVVNGLLAWTANLGGQINHPEIRPGSGIATASETAAPGATEEEHDD